MLQQAYAIEAEAEEGIGLAQAWAARELGMQVKRNPDVVVLRHGLFSVEDARRVSELAAGAPFAGEYKVLVITASRAYHEAQNALLKLFEEPPEGTHLFFIMPSLGSLLPTLRSRVVILGSNVQHQVLNILNIPEVAREFLMTDKEKRSALIKNLASGKDEEERREHRDEAIAILNGIEEAAYAAMKERAGCPAALLADIATLRGYLYDRAAPVRMILEHLSLVMGEDPFARHGAAPADLL